MRRAPPPSGSCGGHSAHQRRTRLSRVGATSRVQALGLPLGTSRRSPSGSARHACFTRRMGGSARTGSTRLNLVRSSSEVRLGADSCSRGGSMRHVVLLGLAQEVGAAARRRTPRSRAARGAPQALRRRARVSRAARRLRLRRSRGGRRGGSHVLGAACPPRGRRRRRRVRPGAGAAGLRRGR
jgi:hypothetical protein